MRCTEGKDSKGLANKRKAYKIRKTMDNKIIEEQKMLRERSIDGELNNDTDLSNYWFLSLNELKW